MIRDQWYVILRSKEVKRGQPVGVTRMGEKLVLWRDAEDRVVCQADLLSAPRRSVKHRTVEGWRYPMPVSRV